MPNRIGRALLGVTLLGAAISPVFIFRAAHPAGSTVLFTHASARAGIPARLTIPRINVDAAIEQVGLTNQGAMEVPKGPSTVAWYNLGPRPGEKGNAVIDGHFGWKNGIPAVFDELHRLQKGNKIYVKDEQGATSTFIVRELRRYGQNDRAGSVFTASDKQAHLVLITCEGIWNKSRKSYSDRIAVFADKEITESGD